MTALPSPGLPQIDAVVPTDPQVVGGGVGVAQQVAVLGYSKCSGVRAGCEWLFRTRAQRLEQCSVGEVLATAKIKSLTKIETEWKPHSQRIPLLHELPGHRMFSASSRSTSGAAHLL